MRQQDFSHPDPRFWPKLADERLHRGNQVAYPNVTALDLRVQIACAEVRLRSGKSVEEEGVFVKRAASQRLLQQQRSRQGTASQRTSLPRVTSRSPETELLERGLEHHRAGRLAEASQCYASLLRMDAEHADALNLSGVLARQRGDLSISERLIGRAIRRNDKVATYHHHLAKTYVQQGRGVEACESYRRALALNPGDADSMEGLVPLLLAMGEKNQALHLSQELLQIRPEKPELHFHLGYLLKNEGRWREALEVYRRAASRFAINPDAYFNLAMALREAGETAEAIGAFEKLVRLRPEDTEAYNLLGTLLHESGRSQEAKEAYLQALRSKPDDAQALCNLGALLMDFSQLQAAEVMLRKAVEIDPALTIAHCNLGSVLARQGSPLAAIEALRGLLQADPTHAEALCTLGFTLDNLGDEAGAETCFKLALKHHPGHTLAMFNLSTHLLLNGNFEEGWPGYELRWQVREAARNARSFPQRRWLGEDLQGRSILVYAEQGFGDTIHFARYAMLLAEQKGARVVMEVQTHLLALLKDLHPGVQVIVRQQEEVVETEFHCPLLSLPSLFQTRMESIPDRVPYLVADPAKDGWAERVSSPKLKVGVVWSGNPEHMRDRLRSIPLELFSTLFATEGATFFSLQKAPAAAQLQGMPQVKSLDPMLLDFTDTAAAIANLDLVIAVDTSVAHLAGALGKPVWILLHHAPDWRWLKERSDSPWYPTAQLFRQTVPGDWGAVLDRVRAQLAELAAARTADQAAPGRR